ncbi:MAG TPA: glucokinase [Pyrinomonadaceae bacterium]|nr:glucokinase [Pyrinomonadaceae bacterium]
MLLAGDVGGTKTDLAIFSVESGPHVPLIEGKLHSADYPSLQALVKEFLEKAKTPVERACFDVAGPVIDGRVKITNLPWEISEVSLARDLNCKFVRLVNDLEAVARAVPILRPSDISTLNVGQPVPKGAIAVVAPGTGLGESFLTWDGSKYVSHSSEGGHADFAPTDERQMGLLKYMFKRFHHVGVERVCSGIGIPNIYEYLRDIEQIPEQPEVAQLIASSTDHTAAITTAAFDGPNPSQLCRETLDTFISILASEAANTALKVMATGGVYLAGGILLHIPRAAVESRFMEAFKRKGRFTQLMERTPVHLILNRAALVGAAAYGLESL